MSSERCSKPALELKKRTFPHGLNLGAGNAGPRVTRRSMHGGFKQDDVGIWKRFTSSYHGKGSLTEAVRPAHPHWRLSQRSVASTSAARKLAMWRMWSHWILFGLLVHRKEPLSHQRPLRSILKVSRHFGKPFQKAGTQKICSRPLTAISICAFCFWNSMIVFRCCAGSINCRAEPLVRSGTGETSTFYESP